VFKDTEGVIRIRILKKGKQQNGGKKKYKRTNNDLQNIHIKLKLSFHNIETVVDAIMCNTLDCSD
jgi:hypothetical protein